MSNLKETSVTLAHHWLIAERGGEKVLRSLAALFPHADICSLVAAPDLSHFGEWIKNHRIITSPLQRIPYAHKHYKSLLPLFPTAIKRLKAPERTRLLISSDASIIKGLTIPENAIHVCYCHSPPRYLWEMQDTYLQQSSDMGIVAKAVFKAITPYVKRFDLQAAQRVDHFIANSQFVANRIKQCYDREATVIYPPVAYDDFVFNEQRQDFYLVVSEMVPYKRIDIAIQAFNKNGKKLIVIGDGPERASLESIAKPNIQFLGRTPFATLREAYSQCRAFIFPGIEDFGITPLEAQASGSPVIAYAKGGALETVIAGKTGLFFHQQTPEALNACIERFEDLSFSPEACRQNAERFNEPRFRDEIMSYLKLIVPNLSF